MDPKLWGAFISAPPKSLSKRQPILLVENAEKSPNGLLLMLKNVEYCIFFGQYCIYQRGSGMLVC